MCLILIRTTLPERVTNVEKKMEGNQYGRTIMISNRRMFNTQVSSENTLTNGQCHIDIATVVLNRFVT